MATEKRIVSVRKDADNIKLKKGETQRKDGSYEYRWKGNDGKRHSVYARTLKELREKENEIAKDTLDDIRTEVRYVTINDLYKRWCQLKRGLRDNTMKNYQYMYTMFVQPSFGNTRLSQLRKSDVRQFYIYLAEERGLKAATIDNVHTVLHQVLTLAVDDRFIRNNPSDNVLRDLKQAVNFQQTRRKALTVPEQNQLLNYLRNTEKYSRWYPLLAVMLGTGLRVGEATGLRWCDIDLEEGIVDVNHTLVFYNHGSQGGCYMNVHEPKTATGIRKVPMLKFVKEAFQMEREYQERSGIQSTSHIDGYADFIFVNRFGEAQHQGNINKAIKRIIRDCNLAVLEKDEDAPVLLPAFSCHTLRHSFTTRMVEAGVNLKVIQDALGHADISTTMNIYADVTKELRKSEFDGLDKWFTAQVG